MNGADLLLYAVTECGCDLNDVRKSLEGGVTFLQLREKELEYGEFLRKAEEIRKFCRVPFVVNDNVEVALASGADGVHIGQSDAALSEARKLLGPEKIIGVSAATPEEALAAEAGGADYLGVGAVFPTGTKLDAASVSRETLSEICRKVRIPVVAIGGIREDNMALLGGTGIRGVAVVSAIYSAPDILNTSKRLLAKAERLFR